MAVREVGVEATEDTSRPPAIRAKGLSRPHAILAAGDCRAIRKGDAGEPSCQKFDRSTTDRPHPMLSLWKFETVPPIVGAGPNVAVKVTSAVNAPD